MRGQFAFVLQILMPADCGDSFFPHLRIPNSRFLFTGGMPSLHEICESDIVCVQRMMTDQNLKFLQFVRSYGMKIVYDLDDNVWQIPKFNPAAGIFATAEVKRGMAACAEWADVLTVSTTTLKKVVERNWGHLTNVATKKPIPVIVYENRVDPNFFVQHVPNKDKIKIGWAGSNTHAGDLALIWPVFEKILNKYPNVFVELVGHEAPFKHERLKNNTWVHISEYTFAVSNWNWDIFIAPLETHKFNNSKSNLKMQEAAILQRPCLASYEKPYEHFCKEDPAIKWQLCVTPFQWEQKLEKLIQDEAFRLELGKKMHNHVLEHFHISGTIHDWEKIIQAAL